MRRITKREMVNDALDACFALERLDRHIRGEAARILYWKAMASVNRILGRKTIKNTKGR